MPYHHLAYLEVSSSILLITLCLSNSLYSSILSPNSNILTLVLSHITAIVPNFDYVQASPSPIPMLHNI